MSSQPTPSPPPSPTASPSPSPSPSPRRLASDDEKLAPPSPTKPDPSSETPSPLPLPRPQPKSAAFPSREDCWSEEATRTLIEAWGAQFVQLNRGNLRQKHWQEVADAVNAAHAAKLRRTHVQCKNRIDTTKKKYKIEKSKVVQSNGHFASSWPHFESLDALIGDSFSKTHTASAADNGHSRNLRRRHSSPPEISPSPSPSPSPETATATVSRKFSPEIHRRDKDPAAIELLRLPWSVPVGPRSKRCAGSVTERNFSVMAAAAAAMEAEDVDDEGYGSRVGWRPATAAGKKRKTAAAAEAQGFVGLREGYRMLAAAIMRLGETYEKVETAKQRQMVELEKQRMHFAKDLEILRAQVQLDNLKRVKCTSQNKNYV